MIIVFLFALLFPSLADAACSGSGLAYSCPSGTTPATVQDTITAASDGAVISFASGAYTWGGTPFYIDNAKGVTLQGAGIDQSIVTIESPGSVCCSNGQLSGTNTKSYRVTGFTFQNAPTDTTVFFWAGTAGSKVTNVRMDHNKFLDFGISALAILYGVSSSGGTLGSEVTGLVDHNEFYGTTTNFMAFKVLGRGVTDFSALPYTATVRGTINNSFFEDNHVEMVENHAFSSPCLDVWSGAGLVSRFNYWRNCLTDFHGSTHQGGPINVEFYGNVHVRDSGINSQGANAEEGYRVWNHHGAWEAYTWGNTVQHLRTIHSQAISLLHYRSADQVEAFGATVIPPGRCDGFQANDGNTIPRTTYYGYPCWGQPGRAPSSSPVWGTLAPLYVWKNVDSSTGNKIDMGIFDPFTVDKPPQISNHVVEGRDMYNAVSKDANSCVTPGTTCAPFDGTTGMGYGTLDNRPNTCTHTTSPDGDNGGGVAYFATDQGSWNTSSSNPYGVNVAGADGVLYRCSATNTWTVHYTPYTYPHPLQGFVAGSGNGSGVGLKGGKGVGLF